MTNAPTSDPGATSKPSWSIFADTLADILADPKHGPTPLRRLDDIREREEDILYPDELESPRELVHGEKLRRLNASLREPGSYATLGRDDMTRIRRYFKLDAAELLRLDAALITTAIERTLKERFDDGSGVAGKRAAAMRAHPIAEHLYPLILDELKALQASGAESFEHVRGMRGGTDPMGNLPNLQGEDAIYRALEPALDAIDRATLALTLSHQIVPHAERLERARAAAQAFTDALSELDEIEEHAIRSSEPWRIWQSEARRGLAEAQERLLDLGG
ncbi:MAG: hypothetical protein ABI068_10625 [Ktedonobacterales bacterium]